MRKCSAHISHVIAPSLLDETVEDCYARKYFLILDESADIGPKKYMAVYIRFLITVRKG